MYVRRQVAAVMNREIVQRLQGDARAKLRQALVAFGSFFQSVILLAILLIERHLRPSKDKQQASDQALLLRGTNPAAARFGMPTAGSTCGLLP